MFSLRAFMGVFTFLGVALLVSGALSIDQNRLFADEEEPGCSLDGYCNFSCKTKQSNPCPGTQGPFSGCISPDEKNNSCSSCYCTDPWVGDTCICHTSLEPPQ
jgi:hypothetical protein